MAAATATLPTVPVLHTVTALPTWSEIRMAEATVHCFTSSVSKTTTPLDRH